MLVHEKMQKIDYVTNLESTGKLLANIGSDTEIWETFTRTLMIPVLFSFFLSSLGMVYYLIGPAGLIGMCFIASEAYIINVLT